MRLHPTLCLVLFLSSLHFSAFGQAGSLRFEHLTTNEGLPENTVVCIFRDSRGLMWFGTETKGLCRYDGGHFKVYAHDSTNKNSLPGNFITNIMEDKTGKLWVSCFDKGVTCFDPVLEKFRNYAHDSTDKKSFSIGYANGGVVDTKGRVWIATWDGGINLYDPAIDGFVHFVNEKGNENSISSNRTKDIKQDKDGFLWFSTWSDGSKSFVQKMDPETRKIIRVGYEHAVDAQGDPVSSLQGLGLIHKVMVDSKQDIWFATYIGVYRFDQSTKTFTQYISKRDDPNGISFNNIRSLSEDDNGDVWMGSLGGGINKYDHKTGAISIYRYDYSNAGSISDNMIRGIYKDPDGRLWIGTYNGGVNILDQRKQEFKLFSNKDLQTTFFNRSSGNELSSFCISPDNTLLVNSGSGMSVYDYRHKSLKKINPVQKLNNELVNTIAMTPLRDGSVLCSGAYRLWYYYPAKQTNSAMIERKNEVFNAIRFKYKNDGSIWILNENSNPDILDLTTGNYERFLPDKNLVKTNDVAEVGDGRIIFTTPENGIFFCNENGSSYKHFKNDSTQGCLPSDNTYFVYADKEKKIWIGTASGLRIFDAESGKFSVPDGCRELSEMPVLSFIRDAQGDLWFSSAKGIWMYSPVTQEYRSFDRTLGLNIREMIPLPMAISSEGYIFAACSDGIVMFNPAKLKKLPSLPHIFISGIKIFGTYLKSDTAHFAKRQLDLFYDQNSITFEFAANDFTSGSKMDYAYMLEGYDTGWINNESRTLVNYTNLPPGDYIFKVKGKNVFLLDSENEAMVRIHISPPFWKTWWFYLLEIITAGSLIWLYISYRERKLMKEKLKLEKVVTERTAEVVAQKEIIEQKNKEVTDSIHYAKTIQEAILPTEALFKDHFPKSFILFKPKDIVSGDFYWISKHDEVIYYATVDCTGHGVPGGFMSMLGSSMLNDIVDETNITEPADVLDHMRERIIVSLKQSGEVGENKDGMDMSFCKVDLKKMTLTYAGANNGLYMIRNNEITEHSGTKQPIGIYMGGRKEFEQFEIPLQKGDIIYSYTDGYADQFGGDKGKKFKWANLEKLLLSICSKNMDEQKTELDHTFETWKGHHEQIDDVLLVGIKI